MNGFLGLVLFAAGCTDGEALRLQNASTGEVTLMINCIDANAPILDIKVSHLVDQSRFDFARKILVFDTHGAEPSEELLAAARGLIKRGVMDSYMVVDYSPEYVRKASERLFWVRDSQTNIGHQGNLVYFYMFDQCPTRYLVHYDLDMVMWSAENYSWVEEGLQLLKGDLSNFYVTSPRIGNDETTWSKRYTCEQSSDRATWVATRNFMMDLNRYNEVLDLLPSFPQVVRLCSRRHIENLLSCSICQMPKYGQGYDRFDRVDIMNMYKNWVLHFPSLFECGVETGRWVLKNMVEGNMPVAERRTPFNAQLLKRWISYARKRWKKDYGEESLSGVPEGCEGTPVGQPAEISARKRRRRSRRHRLLRDGANGTRREGE